MPRAKAKGVASPQKNATSYNREQPAWSSDHSMLPPKQHETFRRLIDVFSDRYDTEIIQAVAQTCNYHFDKCLESLLAMSDSDPISNTNKSDSGVSPLPTPPSTTPQPTAASVLATPAAIKCASFRSSSPPVLNISNHKSHCKGKSQNSKKPSAQSKSKSKGAIPKGSSRENTSQIKLENLTEVEKVKILIKNDVKVFILMRGFPGSGKTFLANSLAEHAKVNGIKYKIVSADDYFLNSAGAYCFRPNELAEAHSQSQKIALDSAMRGIPVIIVDNTNTRVWEMACYVKMAISYCYHVEILEPETPWRGTPSVLYRYTVHNVPLETIERMLSRWESVINGNDLLQKLDHPLDFQRDVIQFLNPPCPTTVTAAATTSAMTTTASAAAAQATAQVRQDRESGVLDENKGGRVIETPPGFSEVKVSYQDTMPSNRPSLSFITENEVDNFFRVVGNTATAAQTELLKVSMVSAESVERQLVSLHSQPVAASNIDAVQTTSNSPVIENTGDLVAEKPYDGSSLVMSDKNMPIETFCLEPQIGLLTALESNDEQAGAVEYLESLGVELEKVAIVKEHHEVETADLTWDGLGEDWTKKKKEPIPIPAALEQRVCVPGSKKVDNKTDVNRNWLPLSGNTGILVLADTEGSSCKEEDSLNGLASQLALVNVKDQQDSACDDITVAGGEPSECKYDEKDVQESESCDTTTQIYLPKNEQETAAGENEETKITKSMPDDSDINETPCHGLSLTRSVEQEKTSCDIATDIGENSYESDDESTVIDSTLQYLLDTQCTEEFVSDSEESCVNAMEVLNKIFPQISSKQLTTILEECHGNVYWAIDFILHSPLILQEADELQKLECSSITQEERPVSSGGKVLSPTRKEKVQQSKTREAIKLKHMIEDTVVLSNNNHASRKNQRKKNSADNGTMKQSPPPGFKNKKVSVSDEDVEEEEEEEKTEFLPMTLDKSFAEQLLVMFGGPLITRMPDFTEDDLSMQVPVELARMLHSHWLESLQLHFDVKEKQFNQLLKNDEKMARRLQEMHNKPSTSQEQPPLPDDIPDLKDIMEMEQALALVKNDQKDGCKNDMATKLSRQLLAEQFPKFDPQALDDVFDARNRNYQDTVDFILESFGDDSSVCTVMAPEVLAKHEQQLLERARQEALKLLRVLLVPAEEDGCCRQCKYLCKLCHPDLHLAKDTIKMAEECKEKIPHIEVVPLKNSANPEEDRRKAMKIFYEYREKAQKQWQQRRENLTKAQNAYRQGMKGVASYYSEVCQLNKQRMDMFNSAAASALFGTANDNLLDLHYLYVTEALQVLDIFLDYHARVIQNESGSRVYSVELVTGRGRRSEGGKSRLKPAVVHRLKQRRLRYEEVNPGALRVFLTRNMMMSGNN